MDFFLLYAVNHQWTLPELFSSQTQCRFSSHFLMYKSDCSRQSDHCSILNWNAISHWKLFSPQNDPDWQNSSSHFLHRWWRLLLFCSPHWSKLPDHWLLSIGNNTLDSLRFINLELHVLRFLSAFKNGSSKIIIAPQIKKNLNHPLVI